MDDADITTARAVEADKVIHGFRYDIPKGTAGDCIECEEPSPRLIRGRCAWCRDGRTRP